MGLHPLTPVAADAWHDERVPKSPHAAYLDEVIAALKPDFKEAGFRKRGTTFNRRHTDLVHVVNFQLDRWNAPRSERGFDPENPGGRFAVNLGIYLPDVDLVGRGAAEDGWVAEMVCQVRERLGVLVMGTDHWWTMTGPPPVLADEIRGHLTGQGFSWLENFDSVDQVLGHWPELLGKVNPARARWWRSRAALVRAYRGDPDGARPELEAVLVEMDRSERAYLCSHAARVGVVELVGCP